jgi:hypothetical protein
MNLNLIFFLIFIAKKHIWRLVSNGQYFAKSSYDNIFRRYLVQAM